MDQEHFDHGLCRAISGRRVIATRDGERERREVGFPPSERLQGRVEPRALGLLQVDEPKILPRVPAKRKVPNNQTVNARHE